MKKYFNGLCITALMTFSVQNAFGVSALRLVSGATTITCFDQFPAAAICDGGTISDFNGQQGAVTFIGSVGNFTTNVSTGTAPPVLPNGHLDLNSVNISSVAGGTLDIYWSDDSSGPGTALGGYQMDFGGTVSPGGTVTAFGYYDTTSVLFAQTNQIGVLGPFGPPAFSGSFQGPGPFGTSYSLTQHLRIVFAGAGSFSGDFALTPVPEPTSVALAIGVALLGVAGLRRKLA